MSNKYIKLILNKLIDDYEKSKIFNGSNKINRNPEINIQKFFKEYSDNSDYESYSQINEAAKDLEKSNFINIKWEKFEEGNLIQKVILEIERVDEIYRLLKRQPKSEGNIKLIDILNSYKDKNFTLKMFCNDLLKKIEDNKSIKKFVDLNNLKQLEKALLCIEKIFLLEEETFKREFSIKLFNDSKEFEKMEGIVISILKEYGDFSEEGNILENLNLINNPGYVHFKGDAEITINSQKINLKNLGHDIGVSSKALNDIKEIKVHGNNIITIENLTSFNKFKCEGNFAIYLGGYHNTVRREFIKKLYSENQKCKYYHFGDIDAGGFSILKDLREKTGVEFIPYMMDKNTLEKHKEYGKPLTENDRKRLNKYSTNEFNEVINYMLENNIKLEQEVL